MTSLTSPQGAMPLTGRVAIITGAGSGIGQATAFRLSEAGAAVVAVGSSERARSTADEIVRRGGDALFAQCDVGDTSAVQRMVKATIARFGTIDILVNNAARNRSQERVSEMAADMPEEHWHATLQTNLSGTFYCVKYALPAMIEKGRGSIINVAAAAGLTGVQNLSAYGASKAGVIHFTKSVALDYGPMGIRSNAILPLIATDRMRVIQGYTGDEDLKRVSASVPLGRVGTTAEAAALIAFLASDESSFITGAVIPIDGGGSARR